MNQPWVYMYSQMALVVKTRLPMQEIQETQVWSLGPEDLPGVGNGNPLWYSCLENPTDRGTWQAIVYRVVKSWTQLKQLSTHTKEWGSPGGTEVKNLPANVGGTRDAGLIPRSGRSPRIGNGI